MFFYDIKVPIECMKNPELMLRILKTSQTFAVDLISNVNFFIFIYTGSKFREIYFENFYTFIRFFKCTTNQCKASMSNVNQIKHRSTNDDDKIKMIII